MRVYIIGNSLLAADSLPVKLLPDLKIAFPRLHFDEVDPNENFIPEEGSVIVDTVEGIRDVQKFSDLHAFVTTKSVTPHDYDLGFHLQLLTKLKKISGVRIIGVPPHGAKKYIMQSVVELLREYEH